MNAGAGTSPPARILVTGGSRGIGFGVARDLASAGHQLWLVATTEKIRGIAHALGPQHRATPVNVAEPESVAALFREIGEAWQGLDAVIHSAAELGEAKNFWKLDPEGFASTLRVNTAGTFFIARAFVQLWLATSHSAGLRRGKIILFAGGGAAYGYPNFLPYGTSKAAVVRMCETMAMELAAADLPIDINIIAPGANETAMLAAVRAAGGEVRTVVPFSKPIALCRWLQSSDSDGISGRFIHVNDPYLLLSPASLPPEALKLRRIDL
jgi:NAD(P)-dependent dehydrogenase (short-subunit alcohol dehydrogenase family)